MQRDLERLFVRYRARGDVRALERVFDRTSRDLLLLAQHLVRDPNDAEDLVQQTFVTAIDRAACFDPSRPLRPWLAGILARQAANLIRRRQSRRGESSLSDGAGEARDRSQPDPARTAEALETRRSIESALARLAAADRRVLEPYLLQERRADEIAAQLGRSAGSVRTQIYRGLRRLRALLPRGAALAWLTLPRGLENVRRSVSRHAAASAVPTGVAATGVAATLLTPLTIGGLIVGQKALLSAGALIAASLLLWFGDSSALRALEPSELDSAQPVAARPVVLAGDFERQGPLSAPATTPAEPTSEARAIPASAAGRALVRVQLVGVEASRRRSLDFQVSRRLDDSLCVDALEPVLSGLHGQDPDAEARVRARTIPALGMIPILSMNLGARTALAVVQPDRLDWRTTDALEIDLTSSATAAQHRFQIRAEGELYFPDTGEVEFPPDLERRLQAGQTVVVELSLEPAPAALLSGRVPAAVTFRLVPGFNIQEFNIQEMERVGDAREFSFTISPDSLTRQNLLAMTSGEMTQQVWDTSGDRLLALFRSEAVRALGWANPSIDGSFELKVPEDGDFVLAYFQKGRPVLNLPLRLELLKRVELPDFLEPPPEVTVSGFVEDHGLFPEGGLALVLTRQCRGDEKPFRWYERELCWTRGEIARTEVRGATAPGGSFALSGVSPGDHRLDLSPGDALSLFPAGSLRSAGVRVPAPATDVQLVLPASLIELRLFTPAGEGLEEEPLEWSLRVEEPHGAALLCRVDLESGATVSLLTPAMMPLRVCASAQDFEFDAWVGESPPAGQRAVMQLIAKPRAKVSSEAAGESDSD